MPIPTTLRTTAVLLAAAASVSAQWVQQSPVNAPSARTGAGMDFVPQNAGLVLFGGSSPLLNAQTWVYDGIDWTQLTPATSPTPRSGAELVFDAARGVAVLYGGLASNISVPPPTSETWEWDGTNWTLATPTANAGPRYRYGACFDLVRGRTVIYGGASTQLLAVPNAETWEYDGATWTLAATTGNPGPRDRPAMCFHLGLGKAVLFGGANGFGLTDQTWLYDGTAGTWTQVATTGPRPPARNAAKLVYDALHDLCVLSGGQDANGPLADTWTFDGVRWVEQPSPTQTVRDHAMAFLPLDGQVVRFGGFVAVPNTLTSSTWKLGTGAFGAGCVGSNGVPSLAASSAAVVTQPWTLDVSSLEPTTSLAFVVVGLAKAPGVDLGPVLGMPGCLAFSTPDYIDVVTGAAGAASWTWPSISGPIGAPFYVQALCLDPAVNAFGFTVSNAVFATISG